MNAVAANALLLPSATGSQTVATLYQRHHSWLTTWLRGKLGNQADAADVAHDTFVRILQSRLAPASILEPRSYLSSVARGLVVDLRRRRALERAYHQVLANLPVEHLPSVEAQAIVVESLVDIDRMLDGLGSKVKHAFLLWQLEQLPYPEIARRVGVSPRTVSNYLAKAMTQCCLMVE